MQKKGSGSLHRLNPRSNRRLEEHLKALVCDKPQKTSICAKLLQPAAMGRKPGRPANSTPLQPRRSQGQQSSRTHEPKFSHKVGRPRSDRVGTNSVFTGNRATLKPPNLRDGDIWQEESEMDSGNVQRWAKSDYTLRAEEMNGWSTILNYSEIAQRDGWLFVSCAPTFLTRDVLEGLDWSVPVSVEEVSPEKKSFRPILTTLFLRWVAAIQETQLSR